ncbi:ThiF family adenylyltransferase [Thalassotalea euphylliae]|uniref:ThiF family adenylyltransferase n=1 Tax=Thalassotalea euphylliae TaxID=1655234 RepID=UPI00362513DD
MNQDFDYDLAYSRNIGWVTEAEQQVLKSKRIAIAGCGGVGGEHILTLVRLGITKFNLSDFDEFGCENTNRQAGANVNTYDRKKLDVMVEMALAINPALDIKLFPDGIDEDNTDEFLEGVDCYVDSLDFFALEARKRVFRLCAEKGIPSTTAAPIGMGTAYLNFMPGEMTFEEYFRLEGCTENEQYLKFFIGLTPAALQKEYLVDPSKLDLANKKGPSTIIGCKLAAGVVAANVSKILLNRGSVISVPWSLHYDAYTNKFKKNWRPGGNNNVLQKLIFNMAKKTLLVPQNIASSDIELNTIALKVLEQARWAASGDNKQNWRFKIDSDTSFTILGFDTSDHVVYDLDRHSSHLALGILAETIDIASSEYGYKTIYHYDFTNIEELRIRVELVKEEEVKTDSLFPYIKTRTVQRKPMGTRSLTVVEKQELEECLPDHYSIQWFESFDERLALAKLNFCNAKTRLTMKEAYFVHKEIIEWGEQYSKTKIPEKALGVDWMTARLMQWLFKSWSRIEVANKYFAGTYMPRIMLDFLPSIKSCAHFAIKADKKPETIEDYFNAGRAVQRFWLTAAKLGLGFQPEQTPVIFARFLENGLSFTEQDDVVKNAKKGKQMFETLVGTQQNVHFLGRLGRGPLPTSRSTRMDLKDLIVSE